MAHAHPDTAAQREARGGVVSVTTIWGRIGYEPMPGWDQAEWRSILDAARLARDKAQPRRVRLAEADYLRRCALEAERALAASSMPANVAGEATKEAPR